MPRTFIRPDQQIQSSITYVSTGAAGAALQTGATSIEDDLNALRVQISRAIDASMLGNWYDDVPTVNGKKRSIKQLSTSVDGLESKTLLARVSASASIAVPAGQNYALLSATNNEVPSANLAIALTTLGAVTAQSPSNGAAFAANELSAIAGNIASQPRNLVAIRDATTLQVIESGGYDVFGLLQVESTAVDGAAFNDTSAGNRAKISFVTVDPATGNLKPAAAADIGGHTINYSYVLRSSLASMPEQNFLGQGVFVDSIADTNVTLQRAVSNAAGVPVTVANDVDWRLGNNVNFKVQNASGSTDLLGVSSSASGTSAAFNTDSLAVNTTTAPVFNQSIQVGTGPYFMNYRNDGLSRPMGDLTLESATGNALLYARGGTVQFNDINAASSNTWDGNFDLSTSGDEWDSYKAMFGQASLISGIVQAASKGSHQVRWAAVTVNLVPAGTNLSGAGATPNLDAVLGDFSGVSKPMSNVKLYLNGQLLRPGASTEDTTQDWLMGTNLATGDVKLTFPVRGTVGKQDVLTAEIFGNAADNG